MEQADRPIERYSWAFFWIQMPLAKVVAWLLLTMLGPFRSFGRGNVPRKGGLLILSNHLSDCDPVALQLACPRPIRFMAKSELFQMPGVKIALKWIKGFPVKRGEPDRAAIKYAVKLLQAGECVCVFPEGELSPDGRLQPLKPGIALIARMAGVPVICAALKNTNRVVPYKSMVPRPAFAWITVRLGVPKTFEPRAEVEQIVRWAENELRNLTCGPTK